MKPCALKERCTGGPPFGRRTWHPEGEPSVIGGQIPPIKAVQLVAKGGKVATAYCVKGKHKVEMANPEKVTMKNGKPAWKGTCPVHNTTVFRIGA